MTAEGAWLLFMSALLLGGLLTGVPVMLVISGVPLIVAVTASAFGAFDLTFLQAFPQRVYGIMGNGVLIAVPLFVFMGVLLEKSGCAERMLVSLTRLLGGSGSMMALSVLIVSTLIAAMTGIIGATIVMLGMIALPAMLNSGLSQKMSSGLICASGTLGQIIPPSIVLILLGDQISNAHVEAQRNIGNFAPDPVSVGDLFAGALLPGLVLVGLYGVYCTGVIAFSGKGSRASGKARGAGSREADDAPGTGQLAHDLLPPVLLIMAVLGSILAGVATPTEAASVGVAGTLLLASAHAVGTSSMKALYAVSAASAFALVGLNIAGLTRIGTTGIFTVSPAGFVVMLLAAILVGGIAAASFNLWRCGMLQEAVAAAVQISAMIFGIIIAASMLSLVFRGFGGDELVSGIFDALPGEKWGMLAATMAVIFALGFVLEFVEIVFIVIPIVGPVLLAADFDPVWIAILVALNLQTSFLTPPFGFALFYFRSVAPASISTWTIYRSIIPFVIIQLVAIGLVVLFPQLATWLPAVLFRG